MKETEWAPSKGERGETEKVRCDGEKKKDRERDRSGARDRGNKSDGEFEGDGVNGDRRRTDGKEAGSGAEGKLGWLTKGTGETGGHRG